MVTPLFLFVVLVRMSKRLTGQEGLLLWLQAQTYGYAGVNVTDFTYSWENGLQSLYIHISSTLVRVGILRPCARLCS